MAATDELPSGETPAAEAQTAAAAGGSWVGLRTREAEGRTFYAGFEAGGQRYNLGDSVYLRPAQPGLPPFVGKLESLHQRQDDGSKWAGVRWYYRPTELDEGQEVSVEENELFWSDDFAAHPLDAVCGRCEVLTPAQADRRPGSSVAHPEGADTYMCGRKYIQGEGRIVPLEDGIEGVNLTLALQEKPYAVVEGRVVQRDQTAAEKAEERPRPKRVHPTSGAGTLASNHAEPSNDAAVSPSQELPSEMLQDAEGPASKRQRQDGESYVSEPSHPASAAAAD